MAAGRQDQPGLPHCGGDLPTIPLPRPFLKVIEAAYIARVQPWMIRYWIRKGALRRYGAARRTLIYRDDLLALLERQYELKQQGPKLGWVRNTGPHIHSAATARTPTQVRWRALVIRVDLSDD